MTLSYFIVEASNWEISSRDVTLEGYWENYLAQRMNEDDGMEDKNPS